MGVDREEKDDLSLKYLREPLTEEEKLEQIRQIAYDLYEQKGSLPGTEFASWLEAAQIVKSRRGLSINGETLAFSSF